MAGRSPTSRVACPRREDLDRVVPDRPVIFPNRDGHDVWVNSKALELAGITKDTPDPDDGRIARDPDGTPIGTLHEGAADLVQRAGPGDHGGGLPHGPARGTALPPQPRDHGVAGRLGGARRPGRVRRARRVRRAHGARRRGAVVGPLAGSRADRRHRRACAPPARSAATGARASSSCCDGIIENQTAAMLQPYFATDGTATDNAGLDFIDAETLTEAVVRLDALGFQAHFHALGDRAVRHALDAVEAARRDERLVRHAAAPRPSPGRPPGRHPALREARRARQRPAAVGRARGADDRAHAAGPRGGGQRPPVPVALAPAARRDARDGLRLERLHARPVPRDGGRGDPHLARHARDRRGVPARTSGSSSWMR